MPVLGYRRILLDTPVAAEGGDNGGPLSVTNAEKLSLPLNTPLATQVAVSDGFYADNIDGETVFFFKVGIVAGRDAYANNSLANDDTIRCEYTADDTTWNFTSTNFGTYDSSVGDVANPWLSFAWSAATLTHPALQQLAAVSTAQGGVFVSGGTQDGVYFYQDGLSEWTLLGTAIGNDNLGFFYKVSDVGAALGGSQPNTPGWVSKDNGGTQIYYSLSDTLAPDLASNWKNASDDSPASISVSSVSVGQLGAGLSIPNTNAIYRVNGSLNGRGVYSDVLGITSNVSWDSVHSQWADDNVTYNLGNVAFPFLGTPEVTVDRDDVANEENWEAAA